MMHPRRVRSLPSTSRRTPARSRRMPGFESLESRDVPAVVFVTTGADAGAGSFRDAVEQANGNAEIDTIIVKNNVSTHPSGIFGPLPGRPGPEDQGQRRRHQRRRDVRPLRVRGRCRPEPGEADLPQWRAGRLRPVSAAATGTVSVDLDRVTIEGNTSHGLHIDDQTLASLAGVSLSVRHSTIAGNGTGAIDQDGIRVDEGGLGSIVADLEHTDHLRQWRRRPGARRTRRRRRRPRRHACRLRRQRLPGPGRPRRRGRYRRGGRREHLRRGRPHQVQRQLRGRTRPERGGGR